MLALAATASAQMRLSNPSILAPEATVETDGIWLAISPNVEGDRPVRWMDWDGFVEMTNGFGVPEPVEVLAGVITITNPVKSLMAVDVTSEGGSGSDFVDTLLVSGGAVDGMMVMLTVVSGSSLTLLDDDGNFDFRGEDIPLDGNDETMILRWDLATTSWKAAFVSPFQITSLTEVSDDTTPVLGGDLGLGGFGIDFPSTPNITDVLDEDTMVSNSATALATQQSIKAYVDANAGGIANLVEDLSPELGANLDVAGFDIVSPSGVPIGLYPGGGLVNAEVALGNFFFQADQSVGASQDDYVLTYNDAAASISLEALPPDRVHTVTLIEPDVTQGITDGVVIFHAVAEKYPSGITIRAIHLNSDTSSSDSFNFEEWNSVASPTPSTIETIAFSAGTSVEDDGTLLDASIAADAFVAVDLPDTPTDMGQLIITLYFDIN